MVSAVPTERIHSTDGIERLANAARRRADDARRRARDAIRRLDRAGEPITFAAVAEAAPVSRAWLYRVPELRSEIERLRADRPLPTRLPTAQRASMESYQSRIKVLLDANRQLREENRQLNDRLAGLLGEHRDAGRGHVTNDESPTDQAFRRTTSR